LRAVFATYLSTSTACRAPIGAVCPVGQSVASRN